MSLKDLLTQQPTKLLILFVSFLLNDVSLHVFDGDKKGGTVKNFEVKLHQLVIQDYSRETKINPYFCQAPEPHFYRRCLTQLLNLKRGSEGRGGGGIG